MGTVNHRAIIATTWHKNSFNKSIAKAKDLGLIVVYHENEVTNGYRTFMICPCGSKEGWVECHDHMEKIKLFKKWVNEQAKNNDDPIYADMDGFYIDAVEVVYGDTQPRIVDHNKDEPFNTVIEEIL